MFVFIFIQIYQVANQVQSYFTINLRHEIRHDLVSNLIDVCVSKLNYMMTG